MTKAKSAAAYVRMSLDSQETSPDQQREEIEKYAAAKNYRIDAWYEDLGVSGDKTHKRTGFRKMLADGINGDFSAIVAWDISRIGRFDQLEAGFYLHPLRQAGVWLDTVKDGLIDLNTFQGRLIYGVGTEAKHGYLQQISADVSRAHRRKQVEGKWVSGSPPFGYVVGEDGKLKLGDPDEVEVVREVFARYVRGESPRDLSAWLLARGVKTKRGTNWTAFGLRALLKNERYLGHAIYGQNDSSKYKDASNPLGKTKRPPRDQWSIIRNAHPAIITPDLFEQAQQRMAKNRQYHPPTSKNRYALGGMIRCGCCGYRMLGKTNSGTPYYICYSSIQRPGECEPYSVPERVILTQVLKVLREQLFDRFLNPADIEAVKARMRELLATGSVDADAKLLRSQIGELDAKIERAVDLLIEVGPSVRQRVEDRIRRLEDQRDALKARLAPLEAPPIDQVTDGEKRIEAAVSWLTDLEAAAAGDYDPVEVYRSLQHFVTRVDCNIKRTKIGQRHRCELIGGAVYFNAEALPSWAVPDCAEMKGLSRRS